MKQKKQVRQSITVSLVLIALLFLLPLGLLKPFRAELFGTEPEDDTPFVSGVLDGDRPLRVLNGDAVEEMDLGTYLVGVVRAEMPASFQPEALKAQAVAARTYTLYKMQNGGNHGDTADICTDFACCQAYISEERARENWGRDADRNEKKIEEAVRATDGQILTYGGQPILAVFHASSAGTTRAAGDVWLNDVPYLQAVSSPEPGDRIPNYHSRKEFTAEEFRGKLLAAKPQAKLEGPVGGWLKNAVADEAGSVETVEVGGVTLKGSTLREILGLRSACFTWEAQGEKLVFFVTGHGHGVGMSQYGADQMAEEGQDYRSILLHYYPGAVLQELTP